MHRLTGKQLLRAASLLCAAITLLFTVLWAVRGAEPAIACGLIDAVARADWPAAWGCLDLAEYEALIAITVPIASILTWLASRKAPDTPLGEYHPTPAEHARNRATMLDWVQKIWIEDRLDQVLYRSVLISLGMDWRAASPRPGSLRLRRPGEQERIVPVNVAAIQLFDEAQHSLLILGEPGSGKTTIMLDLARSLLERARSDETVPIPVVFNPSSFTDAEQSLEEWLVSEFHRGYEVPERIARHWLSHNELALLLDGLDEVQADRRADIVAKLTRYRSKHLAPWLVICCRNDEYAALSTAGLALTGVDTVVLQPLTPDQIKGYLADLAGPEPQRLWNTLQGDGALLEVADTPLMLNVMLLAADVLDWGTLPAGSTPTTIRAHIYAAYLRSMLDRSRQTATRYPQDKTLHWLHWLANKMVENGQTIFLLEHMKRSWFNRPWQRYGWVLIFGLIPGLMFGLTLGLTSGLMIGLTMGLGFGLEDISVREQIHIKFNYRRLIFGLIWGLIGGLIFWMTYEQTYGLIGGLMFGLVSALILGLIFGLITQSTRLEENDLQSRPNAAIHQSLRNGLIGGLIGGLISGMIGAMVGTLAGWQLGGLAGALIGALIYGLFVGTVFAPLFALFFGLVAVIKHYVLRFALFLDGSMPLNYVRFLDHSTERILLRKVGGGYIFIHRTFMEYVANLDLEKWKKNS